MTDARTSFISDQDFTTPAHTRQRILADEPPDEPRPRGASAAGPYHAMIFLAAIWLVISAVPVGYLGAGRYDVFWGDTVVGITVAVVTIVRLSRRPDPAALAWITAGLGMWLLAAPAVLGYGWTRATANDLVVGLLILGLTVLSAADPAPDRR